MYLPWTDARRKLLGALLCTLSVAACGPTPGAEPAATPTGTGKQPVVYGTDNRMDVYAHADATLRARAQQATVALMTPSEIDASNPNDVTFIADTLEDAYGLCSNQRFLNDLTPAFCSGTLIDDDLVLTAGHCVTNASECSDTRFVFNFYRTSASGMQTVTTQDIFSCSSIVVRQEATVNGRTLDFAIVRLDRAATPRFTPAPVRTAATALAVGANVAVIGSGSGIPFKIDSGGSVRNARASTLDYFVASTDTFGGNSGSGVYETGGYTVAGILVRGETDYRANGSCYIVNTCTETGCRGEDITYVKPAVDALCAASTSARLCNTTPPPSTNFTYTATNTNGATVGTTNKVVALTAGQKITVGTCGVTGSSFTGDTYLRLYGPAATEVSSNDDACGGRGSSLTFTAATAGNYEIRAGCYSTGSCGGTVAWTIETGTPPAGGSLAFNATNTNNAQQNTTNRDIALTAGQSIAFGTCTVAGASGTGDTYLRLYNAAGQQVVVNDDACGSLSYATYTVPTGAGGTYQLRAGCYGSTSCGGTVAWTIQ
ncbi:trypsin-like serine peptidase [Pyxidicoccus sp. MSG2]|uniref:trypsin-like serine peptidase n=1 Tax=Pyxidicoccus sp. MSG2 TaxID=2996790 RepID=UPI00226E7C3D|nr:serine protease [Pyxidicoccus sp. MSG2]MCY1019953.1 serine protease [Pyxidicoccus sp. MSG2]